MHSVAYWGVSMRYNVAQLLKDGTGASRRHAIEGSLTDLDERNGEVVPVRGAVTLLRTEHGVLAIGKARATVSGECRRCLDPVIGEVAFEFEEEFTPSIDVETGAQLPLTDEDSPELTIDERHILDLTEVLRQYVLMESAATALCRADCKGLCPQCGKNLNLGPCGCTEESVDPRLAVLKQLFDPKNPQA